MPLPLAPLVGWLIGIGLAWAAREERPDGAAEGPIPSIAFLSRAVLVALALAACVYAPVVGYFAAFHGDWSYLYLVPWRSIPSAVDLILVLVASATIPLGFVAARGAARAGRWTALARLGAGPALIGLALAIACARRLAVSASYAQYHGAFGAERITSSTLGRGVLLAAVALAVAIAWATRALKV